MRTTFIVLYIMTMIQLNLPQIYAQNPNNALAVSDSSCIKAQQLQKQEKYDNALYCFTSAIKANPQDVCAYKGLLECTRKTAPVQLISLLRDYIVWREKEPRNIAVQYALAKTYAEIYKWKKSTFPTRDRGVVPNELIDEANIYRREFEKEMQQTTQADPNLIYPYYDLLDCAEDFAQYDKAFEILMKILDLTPDDLEANIRMISLCSSQMAINPRIARPEMVKMTIKYAKKVLSLDGNDVYAWGRLAFAYQMSGHYEKAIDVYRKCIAMEKQNDSEKAHMCRFWITQMEDETKKGTRRPLIPLDE